MTVRVADRETATDQRVGSNVTSPCNASAPVVSMTSVYLKPNSVDTPVSGTDSETGHGQKQK